MATNNNPTGRNPAAGEDTDQLSRPAELRSPNGRVTTQVWATKSASPAAGSRRAPLNDSAGSPPWFPSDRGPSQLREGYGAVPPTSQTLRLPLLTTEDRAEVAQRVRGLGGVRPVVCCRAALRACAWTDLRAAATASGITVRCMPSPGIRPGDRT